MNGKKYGPEGMSSAPRVSEIAAPISATTGPYTIAPNAFTINAVLISIEAAMGILTAFSATRSAIVSAANTSIRGFFISEAACIQYALEKGVLNSVLLFEETVFRKNKKPPQINLDPQRQTKPMQRDARQTPRRKESGFVPWQLPVHGHLTRLPLLCLRISGNIVAKKRKKSKPYPEKSVDIPCHSWYTSSVIRSGGAC